MPSIKMLKRTDFPRGREERDTTLLPKHYITQEENENCHSIAQKLGCEAEMVLALNQGRYRGLKTIKTRLKAGTKMILQMGSGDSCAGNVLGKRVR